jgi:Protein of unknown function (DUF2490)
MKILVSFFLFFFTVSVKAQLGTWNIVNIKANITEKWEYKGGATYNFNKNFSLQAGLGNYDTYRAGGNFKTPMLNDEFRTWLQLSMKNSLSRVKFEHRYRAEQRWAIDGYRNRFRYRLQAVVPVNKQKLEKGTFYGVGWNEVFFTNKAPYFERNRAFIGGGFEVNEQLAIQTGYLYQFDYNLKDEIGRDFFQLSFLYELAIKKKNREHIPGGSD